MKQTLQKKRLLRWRRFIGMPLAVAVIALALFFYLNRSKDRIRRVLLISIDTCRADYLSCYGYPQNTTPNIDRIAAEGIRFENVISPIPLTLPAHSSMMTGTIPPYHGVHNNTDYKLAPSNLTLAEILKEAGFATSAFISAFVLNSQFGLNQGFDAYNDVFEEQHMAANISERKAAEVSRLGVQWLENNREKDFFLFLHYYDPHNPYEPPPPFSADYTGNQYAGEIAYTDHCIGQVIAKLKALDLYEATLIVVTGDHGEMLGEHGEKDHGFFIYQSAIKVPLIIKLPGQAKRETVSSPVGLIDIVPTVCRLLGIEPPAVQGQDLSGHWRHPAAPAPERTLYTETLFPTTYNANTLLGVVTGQYKYIQTTRPELYDLTNDPNESKNLATSRPQVARILQDRLAQILEESLRDATSGSKQALDAQSLENLRGLGYVGGGVSEDFTFDQDKEDPKDFIAFHVLNVEARTLAFQKEYAQAQALAQKLIVQKPDCYSGYHCLADIALWQNDYATAVTHLQKALPLAGRDDNRFSMHLKLCRAFRSLEGFEEAILHGEKALQIRPQDAWAYANLGQVMMGQKKYDQAVDLLTKALHVAPERTEVLNNLAEALVLQGHVAQALEHYEKSLALSPHQHEVRNRLALLYYQQGLSAQAGDHWTTAIKYQPDRPAVLNSLAWLKATCQDPTLRDPAEAVALAQRACELTESQDSAMLDTLAAAYAAAGRFDEAVQTAEQAIKLAGAAEQQGLAGRIKNRLESYQTGRPRQEPTER